MQTINEPNLEVSFGSLIFVCHALNEKGCFSSTHYPANRLLFITHDYFTVERNVFHLVLSLNTGRVTTIPCPAAMHYDYPNKAKRLRNTSPVALYTRSVE
jgi:hypothetical protein